VFYVSGFLKDIGTSTILVVFVHSYPQQTISGTSPVLSVLISMVDETQNTQDTQKERPRQHDFHRHPQDRKQTWPIDKPTELKEAGLDDEETEEDSTSSHPRSRHRGRPEKKVYEEWASDPYCE
jgi:hypothetical protein